MCGITGKITFDNANLKYPELKKMTDSIAHRGPDGEGHWICDENKVGLGHRRLSIIDLSENASQPMHSSNKRFVISFNGEIYNYIELKEELITLGYKFITTSDTEVLLSAYQEYGELLLQKLDGMFAFAIWDKQKKELFCARDRFGEKPFFYFHDQQQFVFGSEMKAIFSSGISKTTDNQMLYLFLAYDVVENPNNKAQTFYKNIHQLPASHSLRISHDGEIQINKYWELKINSTFTDSFENATQRFKFLFEESIKRRMRSDVKVGSSLSGGVDSSSILCSALGLFPENTFNTFTARFKDKNYDEGIFVNELKKRYSFNTFECYPNSNQVIDHLDQIFYHQEEPFGSTSIVAQWEVMKLAKEHNTTVLLDGQGADETIGGYFKYFLPYLHEIEDKKEYKHQKSAIENHLGVQSYISKKEALRMRLPGFFDKITDISRPYRESVGLDLSDDFKKEHNFESTPFHRDTNLNAFLHNDIFKYGLGKLLRFSDRNAMAHSVEVRLPYLSHQLVEFVFSLPSSYKIMEGWTKYILRKSMEGRVPSSILYRKDKKGFQAPETWMKDKQIQELINESTIKLKSEGILKKADSLNNWKYIMANKLFD
jgi:asparagine synthase (glutamine-hydrolysing)